jgi:hypothetical protein
MTIANFEVTRSSYELVTDTLTTTVIRVDDNELNDVFEIVTDFQAPSTTIRDITADVFQHDHTYRARVALAYQAAFQDAYDAMPHESAPSDVVLAEFSVEY